MAGGFQEVEDTVNTGIQKLGVPLDLGLLLQKGLELLLDVVQDQLAANRKKKKVKKVRLVLNSLPERLERAISTSRCCPACHQTRGCR